MLTFVLSSKAVVDERRPPFYVIDGSGRGGDQVYVCYRTADAGRRSENLASAAR